MNIAVGEGAFQALRGSGIGFGTDIGEHGRHEFRKAHH